MNARSEDGTNSEGVPAVANAMRLVALLRARSPEPVGVSELARGLGLGKSSAHAILQTLQRGGYVVQDPLERTYTLGPTLVDLGFAAAGEARQVEAARAALPALAARTGCRAVAWKLLPDAHVLPVAQAESPHPLHIAFAFGQRFPMSPPFGAIFLAWSRPAEVERWLAVAAGGGFGLRPEERPAYLEDLRRVRARGYTYAIAVTPASEAGIAELEAWLERAAAVGLDPRSPLERAAYVAEIRRARLIPPSERPRDLLALPIPMVNVSAPAFDHAGRVALNITVTGFAGEIPPERVPTLAEAVREASATITAAIGGSLPDPATVSVAAAAP
jgi:DNA-binding IclR family transcriptional regulator